MAARTEQASHLHRAECKIQWKNLLQNRTVTINIETGGTGVFEFLHPGNISSLDFNVLRAQYLDW